MAESKQSVPQGASKQDKSEAAEAVVQEVEAAATDLRLMAEDQAGELREAGFRVMEETVGRVSDGLLTINRTGHDMAVTQIQTLRRLASCRTPGDLVDIQQDYWTTCLDQALEGSRRMAEWPISLLPAWQAAAEPMWRRNTQVEHATRLH